MLRLILLCPPQPPPFHRWHHLWPRRRRALHAHSGFRHARPHRLLRRCFFPACSVCWFFFRWYSDGGGGGFRVVAVVVVVVVGCWIWIAGAESEGDEVWVEYLPEL